VLVNNRKVAGILIETSRTSAGQLIAILGIGVNVNGNIQQWSEDLHGQGELIADATTLETVVGQPVERDVVLGHLLRHLEDWYLALQQEVEKASPSVAGTVARSISERWRSQLAMLGQAVEVFQGDTVVSGIAEDVDADGELLLRLASGERVTITWGDVGYSTE